MDCPCCGKDCIRPARDVLASLDRLYMACAKCAAYPNFDKNSPVKVLPKSADRCNSCGKAPIDAVMLDVLNILIDAGLRDEDDTLRSVGTPLITIGYPLAYPPRLGPKSLIIAGERLSKAAADTIIERLPEVKGVILRDGVPGVVDDKAAPREWSLLSGCDMRGDVVQSLFGDLVIYKSQSKIHIEFPRQGFTKMKIIEGLCFNGKITDVVDGLCGPGTLGLMCILAGAKRVVLNDIWLPAIENVMLNLEANKGLLGIDNIENFKHPTNTVASDPVLVGQASGACEVEVYHGDLAKLFSKVRPSTLCLIDHFPGSDISRLKAACSCCTETVIV